MLLLPSWLLRDRGERDFTDRLARDVGDLCKTREEPCDFAFLDDERNGMLVFIDKGKVDASGVLVRVRSDKRADIGFDGFRVVLESFDGGVKVDVKRHS